MLRHLHIKNLALIDDLEVSFDTGFNVITGETGAGKSLLMQALGLVIGSRGTADLIRHEAQEASVVAVVQVTERTVVSRLAKLNQAAVTNQIDIICTDGHSSPPKPSPSVADAQGSEPPALRTALFGVLRAKSC